jgi:hypothetical protein
MTESILLGVLAQRVPGERLKWNGSKMEIAGRPELGKYIRREYTAGWEANKLLGSYLN